MGGVRVGQVIGCVALVALADGNGAGAADAEASPTAAMVVLATLKDQAAGRQEARRAAARLGYGLAADTLEKPIARRVYVNTMITLQRLADDRYVVVSFLGSEPDALVARDEARKVYPDARVVPTVPPDDATAADGAAYTRIGMLVLGSFKTYAPARRAARAWSKRSGHPYSARGMVYDKKRGLVFADDFPDSIWAGAYAYRRTHGECSENDEGKLCLTVERSEAYEGFVPGLYIVVGALVSGGDEQAKLLAEARKVVPAAYVKQTTLYLGCMH